MFVPSYTQVVGIPERRDETRCSKAMRHSGLPECFSVRTKGPKPRNRMSETFTFGSVRGALGNRCFYPKTTARCVRRIPPMREHIMSKNIRSMRSAFIWDASSLASIRHLQSPPSSPLRHHKPLITSPLHAIYLPEMLGIKLAV